MFNFSDDDSTFPGNNRPGLFNTLKVDSSLGNLGKARNILQSILNLPAYVFNQNSTFWAWGGFWLFTITFLNVYSSKLFTRIEILLLFSHALFLTVFCPALDPRYVLLEIEIGILVTAYNFLNYKKKALM